MILHINSFPGVGKLTIARRLADKLGAKVLDNHSIYNVAFALTEPKTDEFYDTVRSVRDVAYRQVKALPPDVPVILTNAHASDSNWGNSCWDEAIALARRCHRSYIVVVLDCTREENARRIQCLERDALRKPRDPKQFRQQTVDRDLLDRDGDALLRLDVTLLSAESAALKIADWLKLKGLVSPRYD